MERSSPRGVGVWSNPTRIQNPVRFLANICQCCYNMKSVLTLSGMGCHTNTQVWVGYMAVLENNKAYLGYYKVLSISRGLSVIIKTKIFDPILKIDRIIDIFLWEKIFSRKKILSNLKLLQGVPRNLTHFVFRISWIVRLSSFPIR